MEDHIPVMFMNIGVGNDEKFSIFDILVLKEAKKALFGLKNSLKRSSSSLN